MDIEELRLYCLGKKGVTEGLPFGDDTLVFKVGGKIFALANLEGDLRVNLKCEPELAVELRERYSYVIPGYHMNKVHWNTIKLHEGVSDRLFMEWVDHSYDLVLKSLSKKNRQEIEN